MNPRANEKWLLNEHNKTFLKWFQQKILQNGCDADDLKSGKLTTSNLEFQYLSVNGLIVTQEYMLMISVLPWLILQR